MALDPIDPPPVGGGGAGAGAGAGALAVADALVVCRLENTEKSEQSTDIASGVQTLEGLR